MRWEPAARAWLGYADAVAATCAALKKANLRFDDEALAGAKTPTSLSLAATNGKTLKLYPYQQAGVEFLLAHGPDGALLCDDMGTGKTCQALVAARAIKKRTVVVCPSYVKSVWEEQAAEWWPKAPVVVLSGTKPDPALLPDNPYAVVTLNYDIAHAWIDALVGWGFHTLVVDEAHMLQGEKSRRSAAVRALARAASSRYFLTGTPMLARPRDLWNVVDVLSEGRFGKPFDFYRAHCGLEKVEVAKDKTVWKYDGATNLDVLKERLSYFMLRRLKSEVALELPDFTRQIVTVDAVRGNVVGLERAFRSNFDFRGALDRAADGKIVEAQALISSYVAGGHKVVVFTHRRAMAEAVANGARVMGVEARHIHGEMDAAERKRVRDARPDVLAVTMDSTGVGVDLSYADVAVFVELDWVPAKLLQAEARLHRIGQRRNVHVVYVIARGSVDEVIRRTVVERLVNFAEAVGKMDGKLKEDLATVQKGATGLKALYERMMAKGGAA